MGSKRIKNINDFKSIKEINSKLLTPRRVLKILWGVVFVVSCILLYYLQSWFLVNPFKEVLFEDVVDASRLENGDLIVVADSGDSIYKVLSDGEIEWILDGADVGFEGVSKVTVGGDGGIYIYEIEYDNGIRINKEKIVKISEDGEQLEEIYTKDNPHNTMRQHVVGFEPTEDGILYMINEPSGVGVYKNGNKRNGLYRIENSDENILYTALDQETGTLFYDTYSGQVYKYIDGENDELIFTSDMEDGSVPQNICYENGFLYIADIGRRMIIKHEINTGYKSYLRSSEDIEEREMDAIVNADMGGICSVSESGISLWDGDNCEFVDSAKYGNRLFIEGFLYNLAGLFIVTTFIILLAKGLHFVFTQQNQSIRLIVGIIIGVVILGALFLGSLFPSFQEQYMDELYRKEELAASITIAKLPSEAVENISKVSDFMGEDYKLIRKSARDVFFTKEGEDLYCEIYNFRPNGEVVIVYTLEDIYACYPTGETIDDYQDIIDGGGTKRYQSSTSQGDYLYIKKPLTDGHGNTIGIVEVGTDMTTINEKNKALLFKLLINVIAMTVVIIMVALEIVSYVEGQQKYRENVEAGGSPKELPSEIFRNVIFLVFFFTNLTAAILPIYATKISKEFNFAFFTPEIMAAIPVSAEVFSGAVFSAIGGKIIRKLGVRKSVILSSMVFTGSLILRVIPNIWVLSLSSILLGMGWGVELLLVNVFIASLPEEEKDRGYALENIASLTGCNAGVVLGGFLIQWVNYKLLFLITGFSSIILIYVSNRYLTKMDYVEEEGEEAGEKKMNPISFVFKPRIITYFLFMLTPLLISGYYLYYMYPILGDRWGISETHIGYSYIITGVLSVILGSKLTALFSKHNAKGLGLFLSAVLYAEAFLNIALNHNVKTLFLALVLIGIADSFGIPLLSAYYTDLHEVEEYGYDRSMGIYSLFENGAQSLGSFVFGLVLMSGVSKGLFVMIAGLMSFSLIFLISLGISKRRSIKRVVKDEEKESL